MQLEVYFRDDDAWYPGTITGVSEGTCHVTYDDGDEEALGGLAKLPDTEEAVLVYIGALPRRGTVPAGSTHPYLSAINNCHKDLGYEGLAKGRSMVRMLKGAAVLQA
eukprot:gene15656-biopygen16136